MPISTRKTQEFVPIKEIRDGVVLLKDGSMRMILLASSINFALKSPEEQIAIVVQFQNFLNSLDFDTQIYVQSRRLDIRGYILSLEERLKDETNELIKVQITEYIEFIKNFTEATNIMNKTFFVVVPYSPPVYQDSSSNPLAKLFGKRRKDGAPLNDFAENKSQLEQRAGVVASGLSRIGVRIATLGTEELVELYFKIFNPGEMDTPTVMAAEGE